MMSEIQQKFERDMIKTYRKDLWSKFIKAIKKYHLIQDGDRIAIAMSGGKDSLLLAKLFQELKKHPLMNFEIEFISMDPGFNSENLRLHHENATKLGIPYVLEKSNIFQVVEKIANEYPCYMCARMRRGFLYNMAKERGCNKLALGHHFDDVIETSLLNMLYAGSVQTMLPKLKSDNFDEMELIRPMYLIKEHDIKRIMNANGIETMDCGCEITVCSTSSKRYEVKQLIKQLRKTSKEIDKNIFRALENVNVDKIVSWTYLDKKYNRYEEKEE
jgi:tRNA(Ile)-lysidine synthase TilS/MesJ